MQELFDNVTEEGIGGMVRFAGSLKPQVSFAKEPYKRDYIANETYTFNETYNFKEPTDRSQPIHQG